MIGNGRESIQITPFCISTEYFNFKSRSFFYYIYIIRKVRYMYFSYKNILTVIVTVKANIISESSSPVKITGDIAISWGISGNTITLIGTASSSFLCPEPITTTIQFSYKNITTTITGKVYTTESSSTLEITSNIAISRGINGNTIAVISVIPSSFFCPLPFSITIQFDYKNISTWRNKLCISKINSSCKTTSNIAVSWRISGNIPSFIS